MVDSTLAFDHWLHNVRNQLSIILGFSEILLQELHSNDVKHPDLKEIHAAAERAMVSISRPPWRTEEEGGR